MATRQASSGTTVPALLAAVGGVAALIAFFALAYWGISGGSASVTFTAREFAQASTNSGINQNVTFTLLWLVPICGAVGVLLGGARGLGQSVGAGSGGRLLLLIAGVVGVVVLVINALYINSQNSTSTAAAAARAGISYGFGLGFWLALIGLAVVAIGGFLSGRATR
jgi:hypothetical protein